MNDESSIRLWPGIAIAIFAWVVTLVSAKVFTGTVVHFFGSMVGAGGGVLLLLLWWLFFSRVPWKERWLGLAVIVGGLFLIGAVMEEGAFLGLFFFGFPALVTAFVIWAGLSRGWVFGKRGWTMALTVLAVLGPWALLRSDGVRGDLDPELKFRWAETAEERMLAGESGPVAGTVDEVERAAWPGFRGRGRDGVVHGVRIDTDWEAHPPEVLWKRAVGPGWSSFAVAGECLYTQEQRGEEETVTCYDRETGEPRWRHANPVRFDEAMAGPGPRATPTFDRGRLYVYGATGILDVLDARSGDVVWSKNAVEASGLPEEEIPEWGFASSPLVVDDMVVVYAGEVEGRAVIAFDIETGDPVWFAGLEGESYSSPHLTTIDGVPQIVMLSGKGATSYDLAGDVLWAHDWDMGQGSRTVQPAVTPDGGVLIGTGFGMGLRRADVRREGSGWVTEERWTTTRLKPYYNDFVMHEGAAYGFDMRILSSVDLETGEHHWKGGRYGSGQLFLLADQSVLVVVSESGDLALVEAEPSRFSELARIPMLTGKTWNHPVLADGVLYVRSEEQMAAVRLRTEAIGEGGEARVAGM